MAENLKIVENQTQTRFDMEYARNTEKREK
jgi:hypothetical protein